MTNLQETVDKKNDIFLNNVAVKVHATESRVIAEHTSKWKHMREEMVKNHTKMVSTHRISIKDSNTLTQSSISSGKKISGLYNKFYSNLQMLIPALQL